MKKKFSFADLLKELEESGQESIATAIESKKERQYFLIVCEGEKTEPNYFSFFKKKLPKNLLDTVELIGQGDNTINVVQKAIELRDNRINDPINPDYDEVWAVFDKDDFSNERVNRAFELASQNDIGCAFSNQAFELWYVLHFQYLDSDLNRSQYFRILSRLLNVRYKKNSDEIVQLVFDKGDVNLAIRYAKNLEGLHVGKAAANSVPLTLVYKLVEKLMEYCDMK